MTEGKETLNICPICGVVPRINRVPKRNSFRYWVRCIAAPHSQLAFGEYDKDKVISNWNTLTKRLDTLKEVEG